MQGALKPSYCECGIRVKGAVLWPLPGLGSLEEETQQLLVDARRRDQFSFHCRSKNVDGCVLPNCKRGRVFWSAEHGKLETRKAPKQHWGCVFKNENPKQEKQHL